MHGRDRGWWLAALLGALLLSGTAAAQTEGEAVEAEDEQAEPEQDADAQEPNAEDAEAEDAEDERPAEGEQPQAVESDDDDTEAEAAADAAESGETTETTAAPATEGEAATTTPAPGQAAPQASDDERPPEREGPVIEMPAEQQGADEAAPDVEGDEMRGLQEARFARAEKTSIGGYGELHFNYIEPEGSGMPSEAQIDLHRLVLFFAHNFNEDFRFYTEVEIEHGFVADSDGGDTPGKVAIEQAFVDWRVAGDALGLRAGIVLVPMGIVNQWHEPPTFNAVERPMVDKVVIPTTWSEGGIGIFGRPTEALRYELYLTGGLDPSGFSNDSGLRGGRLGVGKAYAKSPAITGRLELEPMLGLVVGVSGYFNMAGQNAERGLPDAFDGSKPDVPVGGVAADARIRKSGFEARAVAAYFGVGDHNELNAIAGTSVDEDIFGTYGEIGYDVLYPTGSEHALVPFVRVEWYDTTLNANPGIDLEPITDLVLGLSYRPIPQVVFKADTIIRFQEPSGDDTLFNLGVGWMF